MARIVLSQRNLNEAGDPNDFEFVDGFSACRLVLKSDQEQDFR